MMHTRNYLLLHEQSWICSQSTTKSNKNLSSQWLTTITLTITPSIMNTTALIRATFNHSVSPHTSLTRTQPLTLLLHGETATSTIKRFEKTSITLSYSQSTTPTKTSVMLSRSTKMLSTL